MPTYYADQTGYTAAHGAEEARIGEFDLYLNYRLGIIKYNASLNEIFGCHATSLQSLIYPEEMYIRVFVNGKMPTSGWYVGIHDKLIQATPNPEYHTDEMLNYVGGAYLTDWGSNSANRDSKLYFPGLLANDANYKEGHSMGPDTKPIYFYVRATGVTNDSKRLYGIGTGYNKESCQLKVTRADVPESYIEYYNGSNWQPVVPYYYNGTDWVQCSTQYYNGSSWVQC